MAFKHRSFSLKIGTSRFGATKIPPSRPLPEPLRYPGLARNVFSLVFLSDPGDFRVKNHVLDHLRSHCVTQALLRRCSEGENRCFHQTYLISLIFPDIFVIFLRSPSRIFRCPHPISDHFRSHCVTQALLGTWIFIKKIASEPARKHIKHKDIK